MEILNDIDKLIQPPYLYILIYMVFSLIVMIFYRTRYKDNIEDIKGIVINKYISYGMSFPYYADVADVGRITFDEQCKDSYILIVKSDNDVEDIVIVSLNSYMDFNVGDSITIKNNKIFKDEIFIEDWKLFN